MGCCQGKKNGRGEPVVRKIAIVGNSGVGKTCLIHRYIHDEFDENTSQEFIPTALHMDEKAQNIGNGKEVILNIYDTGGQETFRHLRKLNYPRSDAAIICFSLDSEESLKDVDKNWVGEMRRICPGIPLLLAGLKKDTREESSFTEGFVRESSGHKMAKKHKMVGYIECSSLRDKGVEQVFEKIAQAAAKKKNTKKVDASDLQS
ncbi:GTP binding protein rho [Plakobranchus ocellatus]|uniref:GTP binding protein rho n=1 Tax=Plakobranchus ocellatus TaxID=259542 RepID=A0AAV4ARR0_9GAST|nr:GTP binding protein rho [Plakobranchus ocellatus]